MFSKVFDKIFDELMDELTESMKYDENDKEEKENPCSYYHSVSDKFVDGRHVSHQEKEVKDGKVTKDVNESISIEDKKDKKCVEDKTNKKCVEGTCGEKTNKNGFEWKIKWLEDELSKKEKTISSLEEKFKEYSSRNEKRMAELEEENHQLHQILANVKSLLKL